MKKFLFIALIIPAIANAQCPQWVRGSRDSVIALLNKADSYLQFNLMKKNDSTQKNSIRLFDEENNSCQFAVGFIKQPAFVANAVQDTYNQVKSIYIKGPKDRMDKLLNVYLLPAVNNCITNK